jgi:glycosyltransferase involved in cell wall biosynthesis
MSPAKAQPTKAGLRQRLARLQAELSASQCRQEWLESALAEQRHARQLLEAAVSSDYAGTIAGIREVVRTLVPRGATVLVVSKGDEQLVRFDGRHGGHFPQDEKGSYAGYHPADSATAIKHMRKLGAMGAQFLLLPNTAFWWLEHYRGLAEHLEQFHERLWRDDRCVLYRLKQAGEPSPQGPEDQRPALKGKKRKKQDKAVLGKRAMAGVRSRRAFAPFNVVCFPIVNWDYRFQRPQQLMAQFAAAGHQVLYLSHDLRMSGEPFTLRRVAENLQEVSLRGSRFKIRQSVLDETSRSGLLASLAALQRAHLSDTTVAMVQSPFWWPVAREAAAQFGWPVVYDCMDHHAGFATSHPLLVEQERELLVRAELVVASSGVLEAQARKRNGNVLLLRNACDYDHFAEAPPKTRGGRPTIGYYGAIAEWFDSDLVADLAERRPGWDFILVGSTVGADTRRLSNLHNVSLPGEKPYVEIPGWLAKFDVTILPFRRTPLTEATNPVKAYEILAAGKPLVSVPLPEMRLLIPLVRLARTAAEFRREIAAELSRPDPKLSVRRRAFARANTWRKRFEAILPVIRNLLASENRARP